MGKENLKFGVFFYDFRKVSSGTAGMDMKLDDGAAVFDFFHTVVVLKQGSAQETGVGIVISQSGVQRKNSEFFPVNETICHEILWNAVFVQKAL